MSFTGDNGSLFLDNPDFGFQALSSSLRKTAENKDDISEEKSRCSQETRHFAAPQEEFKETLQTKGGSRSYGRGPKFMTTFEQRGGIDADPPVNLTFPHSLTRPPDTSTPPPNQEQESCSAEAEAAEFTD